jgi:hypothetical protein
MPIVLTLIGGKPLAAKAVYQTPMPRQNLAPKALFECTVTQAAIDAIHAPCIAIQNAMQ